MRYPITLSAIVFAPLQAAAVEPLAGPENYQAVCKFLQPVASHSEALVQGDGSPFELSQGWMFRLHDLAFSAETRNTVDADDLDPLIGAAEAVQFMSNTMDIARRREMIRPAIEAFGRKYRCRIEWDE